MELSLKICWSSSVQINFLCVLGYFSLKLKPFLEDSWTETWLNMVQNVLFEISILLSIQKSKKIEIPLLLTILVQSPEALTPTEINKALLRSFREQDKHCLVQSPFHAHYCYQQKAETWLILRNPLPKRMMGYFWLTGNT